MSGPGKDEDDRRRGDQGLGETDPEELYPPRPRLTPVASLALVMLLGLALWVVIFLLVG